MNASVKTDKEEYTITHEWASDYHQDSCDTYSRNIANGCSESVHCEDIHSLNLNSLGEIDAFAYGFPCNDFSNVGEKLGVNGKYGALYSFGVQVLDLYKPKFFVAENVGGLNSKRQEDTFNMILSELSAAGPGYDITAHLYRAEEYGVPQMRHRVIIVGIQKSFKRPFKVPAPTHSQDNLVTCRDAIEVPPIKEDAANNEFTKQSDLVVERLKYIKPGENAWSSEIPEHLRLNVKGARFKSDISKNGSFTPWFHDYREWRRWNTWVSLV